MDRLFTNAQMMTPNGLQSSDLRVHAGRIAAMGKLFPMAGEQVTDCKGFLIFPGFVDVHVHLREPGFFYKETIATGTAAAARGGYTAVCAMPNLLPPPDTPEHLAVQLECIKKGACIRVIPYGTITRGQAGETLSDMSALSPFVAGFSDDGKGVQDAKLTEKAMLRAKQLGKLIVAHCEDNALLRGGYIHDGEYARLHHHRGICSKSEWGMIERDLELVRRTGCAYHVCHVSTKESVELIRRAKAEGLNVTCETAPHYLLMDESMLEEDGRFKMNPPLRAKADREALVQGLIDGTVDCIATDHAPHSAEEKSRGLEKSLMGVVGLETAFPLLYTHLVLPGILSLETLVHRLTAGPGKRFGLGGALAVGEKADFSLWDPAFEGTVNPEDFVSMGKSTPFAGWNMQIQNVCTVCGGRIVYSRN